MAESQNFASGAILRTNPIIGFLKPKTIPEEVENSKEQPVNNKPKNEIPNLEPTIAPPVENHEAINPFDVHSMPTNFMALLVASRRSGKSALTEYLLKELQQKKRFTHIFLISPSDAGFKPDIPKKYRSKDLGKIRWIMDKQIEVAEHNRKQTKKKDQIKQRVALIVDDAGHMSELHRNDDLKELAMIGRHIGHPTSDPMENNGISTFVLSQAMTAVSPKMRRNCDIVFCNNIASATELDTCLNEGGFYTNSNTKNKSQARELFHELVREKPYRFLAIENYRANKNNINDYVKSVDADIDYKHKRLFGNASDDESDDDLTSAINNHRIQ